MILLKLAIHALAFSGYTMFKSNWNSQVEFSSKIGHIHVTEMGSYKLAAFFSFKSNVTPFFGTECKIIDDGIVHLLFSVYFLPVGI